MKINTDGEMLLVVRAPADDRGQSLFGIGSARLRIMGVRSWHHVASVSGAKAPPRTPEATDRPGIAPTLAMLSAAALVGAALTATGANLLSRAVEGDMDAIRMTATPRLAAYDAAGALAAERAVLAPAMERVPASAILNALARSLPAGSRIVTVEQTADSGLAIELLTNDPDLLAAPFAKEPALRTLMQTHQRPDGRGRLIVGLSAQPS